ncbi:MAG: hypothetical protein AAF827_02965 [Cyanobacteria bacterium P01_D01_bin.6]
MRALTISQILASATFLSVLAFAQSAWADSMTTETNVANSLLPLEIRSVGVQTDANSLNSVANEINNSDEESAENADITDLFDASFFESLIDENGNIDLPLGVTVFEAMGTTSIGFGSDF